MTDKEFLSRVGLMEEQVTAARLNVAEVRAIYEHHQSRQDELLRVGETMQSTLRRLSGVHSTRVRVKTPTSLVGKIIRKCTEDKNRNITRSNYQEEVRDLIGLRALHLFKEDWKRIHHEILDLWKLHPKERKPIAYYREGDSNELRKSFKDAGFSLKAKIAGYRSIHYVIMDQPYKNCRYYAEIQVRTIFEEAWSEIDHQVRYPNHTNNELLKEYLLMLNRVAGSADEMASFLVQMKHEIQIISELAQQRENEKQAIAEELQYLKAELAKTRGKQSNASQIQKIEEHIDAVSERISASDSIDMNLNIKERLAEIRRRYREVNGNSSSLFDEEAWHQKSEAYKASFLETTENQKRLLNRRRSRSSSPENLSSLESQSETD